MRGQGRGRQCWTLRPQRRHRGIKTWLDVGLRVLESCECAIEAPWSIYCKQVFEYVCAVLAFDNQLNRCFDDWVAACSWEIWWHRFGLSLTRHAGHILSEHQTSTNRVKMCVHGL